MMNPTANPERITGTASSRNPGGVPRQSYDKRVESATIPKRTRTTARRVPFSLTRGCGGRGGQRRRTAKAVEAMPMPTMTTRSSGARRKSKKPRMVEQPTKRDAPNTRFDRRSVDCCSLAPSRSPCTIDERYL